MTTTIDDQVLVVERTLAASPDKVFDAWVNPEILVQWWGPEGMSIPQHSLDLREGGAWEATMRNNDGGEVVVSGVYKVIDRPNRLVFTWAWRQHLGLAAARRFSRSRDGCRSHLRRRRWQYKDDTRTAYL